LPGAVAARKLTDLTQMASLMYYKKKHNYNELPQKILHAKAGWEKVSPNL